MKKNLMKRTVFVTAILLFALFANAQNYKDISDKVILRLWKPAKEELDKRWTNAKFIAKPDAYILKTGIYSALASDSATAATPQGEQLLTDAEAAWAKYKEMDAPQHPLLKNLEYKDAPLYLYSALFAKGLKAYQAEKWEPSFQVFKRTAELSDMLAAKEILGTAFDTTVYLLTAYTAEQSGHKDDALKYYAIIADKKIGGPSNEFVYRALVLQSFSRNDMAGFEKYKALGKQLYPTSEYFDYDKTDFAVGLTQDFAARLKAMEEVLAKDPNDYKANLTVAQLVFDTLHPKDGTPPAAPEAAALETKMISALTKAASIKPDEELVWLVLGDHYIDKADKVNDARAAHVEDMKKRTKPGAAPAKPDIAKRDELDKEYGEAFDKAREPYEKAADIMAKKTLTGSQKQQYRKVAGYLGDIYNFKRAQAKAAPDVTKYTAEAKKWNDLYDTLR
jgi:hypothetical protein